jgi:hypothetical protein
MKSLFEFAHANVTRSIFTFLICACLPLSGANKSGFVSNIETPTEFDAGGTHVVLNDNAECETETLDEAIVLKRKIYDGVRAHMYFIRQDDLVPASITATPCKTLGVQVGTRMTLTGEQRVTGVFAATHAIAYLVQNSKRWVFTSLR